jgi:hypothetical protein
VEPKRLEQAIAADLPLAVSVAQLGALIASAPVR